MTEPAATDFGDLTEVAHLISRARDRLASARYVSTDPTAALVSMFREDADLVGAYHTLCTGADLEDGAPLEPEAYSVFVFANAEAAIAIPLGAFSSEEGNDGGPYWAEWNDAEVSDFARSLRIRFAFNDSLCAGSLLDLVQKAHDAAVADDTFMDRVWALHVADLLATARDVAGPDGQGAIDLLVGLGAFEEHLLNPTPADIDT